MIASKSKDILMILIESNDGSLSKKELLLVNFQVLYFKNKFRKLVFKVSYNFATLGNDMFLTK